MSELPFEDELPPEDIEKLLKDLLSSNSRPYSREQAAKTLGSLNFSNNYIVDELMSATRSKYEFVRRAAVEALYAPVHQAILERRGLKVETFWQDAYPPKICARCRASNSHEAVVCTQCGLSFSVKPTDKWLPSIWLDVLVAFLLTDKSGLWVDNTEEELFASLTLEPNPLPNAILGLLGVVALPFCLLVLLVRTEGLGTLFVQSLAGTFISFFLIAGITYMFSRLLGGRVGFGAHTYLLSLIYAPLTLIGLVLSFSLLLLLAENATSCLSILRWVLGILSLILITRVFHHGQQLSKWQAILVTSMSVGTMFVMAIGIGLSLIIWSKATGTPLTTLMTFAQEEQVQEQPQMSQRAAATSQAREQRLATETALLVTAEARAVGTVLQDREKLESLSFKPDGRQLVTTGKVITVWDTATLGEVAMLSGHSSLVTGSSYSLDGLKLATADDTGIVKIWDTQTWQEISTFKGVERAYNMVAFSPDSKKIVVKGGSYFIVLDAISGKQIYTGSSSKYRARLINVAYSPDGSNIMAVIKGENNWNKDGVQIWNAQTGREVTDFGWGDANSIISAKYSPDGQHMLIANSKGEVEIWDTRNWASTFSFQAQRSLNYTSYSPDGRNIITGADDRTARVWQATTGREIVTLVHQDDVWLALFSPDGQYIITMTDNRNNVHDNTVVIWDTNILQKGGTFSVKPGN
jgi:ribosomal protein L40E